MTNPIKNNSTPPPPSTDPYSKSYGNDPYGGGYDPGMGEEAPPTGDPATDSYANGDYGDYGDYSDYLGDDGMVVEGGDEGMEGEGGGVSGPVDEASVRQMLRDLQGTMSESDYKAFQGRINATTGMSPDRAATELSKIAEELNMIANPQESVDEMTGEDGETPVNNEEHAKAVDDFKDDLEDYRDEIMDMENLSEEEKTQFVGQIDTMINSIELDEKDPAKLAEIDVEGLKADLDEIKGQVDAGNQHSQGVKSLAELAGLTPEELAAKAEAKGINLDNVPVPPTMELFDFLKEISPELKGKIEAVETAVAERAKAIEDGVRACNNQNNANDTNDTSAADNQSMTSWQNLLDLKWHQDSASTKVRDAMKAVSDALLPLLGALYPGQDVKLVESSGVSGWEKTNQDFLNADKISIGGTTIDLFGGVDGKLHSSTTDDNMIANEFEIPTILYDGSGTSSWKPRKSDFTFYGDAGKENDTIKVSYTDDNEMGGNTLG